MSSIIGIKVADGAFFPVLADNVAAKKRFVLTTAHDKQTSVQIDFYRTTTAMSRDTTYIGTLLLENIAKKKKGMPSIEVILSVDGNGEFSASAHDIDNPKDKGNHVLTVSMEPHTDEETFKNIAFDENESFLPEEAAIKENAVPEYADAAEVKEEPEPSAKPKVLIAIGAALLLILLVISGLHFFVFKTSKDSGVKDGVAETAKTEQPAEEAPPVPPPPPLPEEEAASETPPPPPPAVETMPPVIAAPVTPVTPRTAPLRERPPTPVSSYKVPAVIPAEGVPYKISWGDTLWDISQAFYRTPWRYNYLARYNGIRNPDRIVSGRTIRIPPLPK